MATPSLFGMTKFALNPALLTGQPTDWLRHQFQTQQPVPAAPQPGGFTGGYNAFQPAPVESPSYAPPIGTPDPSAAVLKSLGPPVPARPPQPTRPGATIDLGTDRLRDTPGRPSQWAGGVLAPPAPPVKPTPTPVAPPPRLKTLSATPLAASETLPAYGAGTPQPWTGGAGGQPRQPTPEQRVIMDAERADQPGEFGINPDGTKTWLRHFRDVYREPVAPQLTRRLGLGDVTPGDMVDTVATVGGLASLGRMGLSKGRALFRGAPAATEGAAAAPSAAAFAGAGGRAAPEAVGALPAAGATAETAAPGFWGRLAGKVNDFTKRDFLFGTGAARNTGEGLYNIVKGTYGAVRGAPLQGAKDVARGTGQLWLGTGPYAAIPSQYIAGGVGRSLHDHNYDATYAGRRAANPALDVFEPPATRPGGLLSGALTSAVRPFQLAYNSITQNPTEPGFGDVARYGWDQANELMRLAKDYPQVLKDTVSRGVTGAVNTARANTFGTGPTVDYEALQRRYGELSRQHNNPQAFSAAVGLPAAAAAPEAYTDHLRRQLGTLRTQYRQVPTTSPGAASGPAGDLARDELAKEQAYARLRAQYQNDPEAMKEIDAIVARDADYGLKFAPPGQEGVPAVPFPTRGDYDAARRYYGQPGGGAFVPLPGKAEEFDKAVANYTGPLGDHLKQLAASRQPPVPGPVPAPPEPQSTWTGVGWDGEAKPGLGTSTDGGPRGSAYPPAEEASPATVGGALPPPDEAKQVADNVQQIVKEPGAFTRIANEMMQRTEPPSPSLAGYWEKLGPESRILLVAGLSLGALWAFKGMFGDEEEGDGSFLSRVLAILGPVGLGAAAWGAGGGNFGGFMDNSGFQTPKLDTYRYGGNAITNNLGAGSVF